MGNEICDVCGGDCMSDDVCDSCGLYVCGVCMRDGEGVCESEGYLIEGKGGKGE